MVKCNTDYRKELRENQEVRFLEGKCCPRCKQRLVVLPPERIWCESVSCTYAEMHLVGNGVSELKTY